MLSEPGAKFRSAAIASSGEATVSGEIIANRFKLRGSTRVFHPVVVSQWLHAEGLYRKLGPDIQMLHVRHPNVNRVIAAKAVLALAI